MNAVTIFVHGFNGNADSTDHLIHGAQKNGWAQKMLVVKIKNGGAMDFDGELDQQVANPMVQVLFENNRAPERRQVSWMHQLLIKLRQSFGVEQYNGVGHSLGSNVLVNLAIKFGKDSRLPALKKLVTIAGPFNGLHGFLSQDTVKDVMAKSWEPNKRTHHFKKLVRNRHLFPKGAEVLNVIGSVDGILNNDVYVAVDSARAVGYLLDGVAAKVSELMVIGPDGYHCELNRSQNVSREINQFLWDEKYIAQDFKLINSYRADKVYQLAPEELNWAN
ncbi:alpha/beta hydrolase [Pediococcus pentosaceus]